MENHYTAHTKTVNAQTFYFVKKFNVYPELGNVPPMLESFGMHIDFDKACAIASITDPQIKQRILSELEGNIQQAKVIDLNKSEIIKKKAR